MADPIPTASTGPGFAHGPGVGSALGLATGTGSSISNGDKALVILQSLLCLLREKNLLTRADIEELDLRVAARAADCARDPFPCRDGMSSAAAGEMHAITEYIGRRYGGKHRRG